MKSEKDELKSSVKRENNIDINLNETQIEEVVDTASNLTIKSQIHHPLLNTQQIIYFPISIINYFAIGISLIVYAIISLEAFEYDYYAELLYGYFLVSGVILYIFGIFDWYQGEDLMFLIDFVFSFHLVSLFLVRTDLELGEITSKDDNEKLYGTYFLIFVVFIFFVGLSSKSKGMIFIINYIVLFFGHFTIFIFYYINANFIKTIYSIILIASGAIFWLIGVIKIIDNFIPDSSLKILKSSDD